MTVDPVRCQIIRQLLFCFDTTIILDHRLLPLWDISFSKLNKIFYVFISPHMQNNEGFPRYELEECPQYDLEGFPRCYLEGFSHTVEEFPR